MVDWDPRLGDTVSFSLSCSASSIVTESSLSADTSLLQSSTCKDLGTLVVARLPVSIGGRTLGAVFAEWWSDSKLADIEQGLAYLARHVEEWGVTSLAVPPLGAGSGGLDWASVGPTLYRHLDQLPIPVLLYAPFDAPKEQATVQFLAAHQATAGDGDASRLPPGAMVIAEIVRRIDHDRHAWPVGRTRLQKLVYFATAAGVPTSLEFTEGSYGPFAEDLQSLLRRLVNNGILTEARMGRMLAVRPGPTFADASARYRDSIQPHEAAIGRVADLLARLDTQHTEIAASVHFAAGSLMHTLGRRPTEREVLAKVQHWKQRRQPPLPEADIVLAIHDLAALGWIDVIPSPDLPPKGEMVALA
jgi:hypothetical protein